MLNRDDYTEALQVQDACNLSGVVIAFARVLQKLRDSGLDSNGIHTHPLTRCWADKIAHLAGVQDLGNANACEAFNVVQSMTSDTKQVWEDGSNENPS